MKTIPIDKIISNIGRLRILNILSKVEEINATAITKFTRMNHSKVIKNLEELSDMGIVQEKRFGRIRIFSINLNNEMGRILKEFFELWK